MEDLGISGSFLPKLLFWLSIHRPDLLSQWDLTTNTTSYL